MAAKPRKKISAGEFKGVVVSARAKKIIDQGTKRADAVEAIRKTMPHLTEARLREIARMMAMADDEFPRVVVSRKEFDKIAAEAMKKPTRQAVYYIVAD